MKSETAQGLTLLVTLFAIWIAMVGLTVWGWHDVAQTGGYSMIVAMGCPFCAVGMVGLGITSIFFPGNFANMPEARARKAKNVRVAVIAVAFAAATVNFFHVAHVSNAWHPPETQEMER